MVPSSWPTRPQVVPCSWPATTGGERGWFRRTLAQEDAPARYSSPADPDGDVDNVAVADVEEAFAAWRQECRIADTIVAAGSLEDHDRQRSGRLVSVRWVLIHMVDQHLRVRAPRSSSARVGADLQELLDGIGLLELRRRLAIVVLGEAPQDSCHVSAPRGDHGGAPPQLGQLRCGQAA